MKLCKCGCGKLAKPGNRFIRGHNARLKENSQRMKKTHRNWLAKDPESYRSHQKQAGKIGGKIGGKRVHELYPQQSKKTMLDTHKKHPNMIKDLHKRRKSEEPEKYHSQQSNATRILHKKWKERDPEGYKQHQSNAAKRANETIRGNKPYIWKGVHFMSNEEMEVAKKLLIEPIVNVNCHIRINGKVIDFFPQENDLQFQGCFVEYHPWDWFRRTEEEYYNDRKEIIENSQHKGTPLIVLSDMEDI